MACGQKFTASVNRDTILIGEQFQYELLIEPEHRSDIVNVDLPDSIPHFEIVSSKPLDTLTRNNRFLVYKSILFTSFDSGSQVIPSFNLEMGQPGAQKVYTTPSLRVEVGYAQSDSTEIHDIKPIIEVDAEASIPEYIYWAAAIVILIALMLYWYLRKGRKRFTTVDEPTIPAYNEALQSLARLNWEGPYREQVIDYYDKLSAIFKRYYGRVKHQRMLSKTTGDLLVALKSDGLNREQISALADSLRGADAVKFARFMPDETTAISHKKEIQQLITWIHQSTNTMKS